MRKRLGELGRLAPRWVVTSILGVGSFALAQPLLDLLGRNPEFFIARRFPGPEILLLAALLVGLPLLAVAVVLSLRVVGREAAGAAHLLALGAGCAIAAAATLVGVGAGIWPRVAFVAVACLAGLVAGYLYASSALVRTGFAYLGLAPLVFVAWFALGTPVSQVVFASDVELPEAMPVGNPVPVVILVYDEFPLATIVRPDGSLADAEFPNLARLAADGVWYRNGISIRQQTEEALPAILTGVAVSQGSIPTTADHPFNLFTLLSASHDVAAVENVTDLCPDFVCSNVSRPVDPFAVRWRSVATDLAVVYGHLVLPDELASSLPPIDQGWGGFNQDAAEDFDIIERFLEEVDEDRRLEVERFLATFDTVAAQPPLRFAHLLYPHHPWDLTADGRVHGAPRPPGRDNVGWGDDAFLVAQAWQRHLIQSRYADRILGQVLERLDQAGIYDQAMILLVADHGITIRPGTEHQRVVTPETLGTIPFVPTFVKYPGGSTDAPPAGTIDDLRAETTDLLPTIADVVDIRVPWNLDGISLLDEESRAQREASVVIGTEGPVSVPLDLDPVLAVAAERESWFPGGDPYRLAPRGWHDLLGVPASGRDDEGVELVLDQEAALGRFRPGGDPVPSYLSGRLIADGGATGEEIVVAAVNGVVAAVSRTYHPEADTARWEMMIDPALLDGGGEVEIWYVVGSVDEPTFLR